MPVSTFSSGHSAVRSDGGHGALIARWNSTRERIAEDNRRMSISEINEMDGGGLHERDNWPLPSHAEGDAQSLSPRKTSPLMSPPSPLSSNSPSTGTEDVDEDAMGRTSDDIMARHHPTYSTDSSVPPIEEGDVGEHDSAYISHPHVRTLQDPSLFEEKTRHSIVDETSEASSVRSEHRPLHEQTSIDLERVATEGVSDLEEEDERQTSRHVEETEVNGPGGYEHRHGEELEASRERVPEHGLNDIQGRGSRSVSYSNENESETAARNGEMDMEDEERDIATPIPWNSDGCFERTSTPATPRPNAPSTPTPNTNGHTHHSSISKSTPPSRTSSRRSTHTQQLPYNRNRIRYSWQSMEDSEPSRPRIHIIKLVSNTATASAGFPQGEAFGFSISPAGRRVAAYNSARLYILQTAALPVGVSQDYALRRRPLAVEIVDEGNMIAILADEHTVNIYDLGHRRLKLTRSIKLDFPTACITLAPTGGLLAAAYDGGVEIFSLDPKALPTDRRAVRSQKMDRLRFSNDGSTLLGTTTRINASSTVLVSVPVFPAAPSGIPTPEELKEAWCSDLLHPENIRSSSHATFMRGSKAVSNDRLFAWNGSADTFGILNASNLEYGNIDFPVVISPPLSTCGGLGAAIHSCPAVDEHGDTVAMIVNDRTIRLYIVPQRAEDDETTMEAHSIDHELDEGYGCPFSEVQWVHSSASLHPPLHNPNQVHGRLIVTSPGGVVESNLDEEIVYDIEGGRIILFDFDPQFVGQAGQTFSLTLGKSPPQMLEEPQVDVADEVALVRRRTVNQSKTGTLSQRPVMLGRAATTFGGGNTQPRNSLGHASPSVNVTPSRRSRMSIHSLQSEASRSLPDLLEGNEALDTLEVLEEPYAQNAPRSQASLQRAASNAQRHRFQTLEERNQERASVDSNGNFLPLPEYTEEPNAPLPSRFRALAGLDAPAPPPVKPAIVTNANDDRHSPALSGPATAPPNVGDGFSAEQAFATAIAAHAPTMDVQQRPGAQSPTSTISPVSRMDTFSSARSSTYGSLASMPRSLRRAYGNQPPPALIGEWENISPVSPSSQSRQLNSSHSVPVMNGTHMSSSASVGFENEEVSDIVTPVSGSSPFSRFVQHRPQRYSTSQLNPPGYASPERRPSTASSYAHSVTMPSPLGGRALPPHMQAFRNAAAAAAAANSNSNASSSLFPPTHPSDHVPLRPPPAKAGSVPHPITGWHPPAPSIAPSPPGTAGSGTPGNARGGHSSRKSSLSNRTAFTGTSKAKKIGIFSRTARKKKRPFAPEFNHDDATAGGESVLETRSMFTTLTKREGKCIVM